MFAKFSQPPETKIAWENCESDRKCIDSKLLENHLTANPSKTGNEQLTRHLHQLRISTRDAVTNKSSIEVTAATRRATDTGNQNVSSALSSITSLPCASGASSVWGKEDLDDAHYEQGDFSNSSTERGLSQCAKDVHQSDVNKNNRQSGTLELLAKASAQLKELRLSVSGLQPSATETAQPPGVGAPVTESWKENAISLLSTNGPLRYSRLPFERDSEIKETVNDQSQQSTQEMTLAPPKRAAR
ncbi:unnamed protein product, partial [Schistocephalus solidus]|uniref:Uncharacterized protein n=1 Tax=Schistocephalus solidus TaxID=70667 RepID=A0A183TK36_SCHSO